jgi:putative sigma-54 modulation protein
MKVTVHSVHFDADKDLLGFVEEKVSKLESFYDGIIGSEVFLRIDNSSSNDNKVAEVKMLAPGKELFAKKQCKSFEEATDAAVEAIRRQMKKHKEKMQNS